MSNKERRHHNNILYGEKSVTKIYESREGFERELLAYKILSENNFPLTKILYVNRKNKKISFEKVDYEDGLEKLTTERVGNAAQILYGFHNISVNEGHMKDISDPRFSLSEFSENLTRHVIKKYVNGLSEYFYMGNLESELSRLGSKLNPEKFSYTWFDAKMRHFFFDQKDVVRAIIDFEYFGVFDPLVDLGNLFADISELEKDNPRPLFDAILNEYPLDQHSLEALPFYMITSKLTQALCIDLPKGDTESAKKAVELSKKFSLQNLF